MESLIYLRLRYRVEVRPDSIIKLSDIAQIIAPENDLAALKNLPVYQVTKKDKSSAVIDIMEVINVITKKYGEVDIQNIGPTQTIIEIIYKKKKVSIPFFLVIWILLFIGSALAIMNFHEDVSMRIVHQKIYRMITGHEVSKPLILQIPYSIGLGLGMIIFFNHIFKKRFNEEPSPLEVEIFNYQQDVDHYVALNENKESIKRLDDD
ncbi:stage V sporulation protein AA [Heyndrickxia sporothermodurans]|uniref:stage V sporulation protein AA n=1 Tax=Heyndrickxia sporothermodurans TaxID=46224 RepID=UPI002DBBB00F|nr:stage V sporulation protein AA [Heyndrickxia sporothermodurans]MEB6547630.1 stage V sporulation protein AA [Heyndrickxia sporothermodurans]MED3654128.1 stage V sporulation protein AA [Heyndrickxia sporothermodurans]MED3780871.1 stage V sporulation protein AA [Heyndrickxia sporothermodurans]